MAKTTVRNKDWRSRSVGVRVYIVKAAGEFTGRKSFMACANVGVGGSLGETRSILAATGGGPRRSSYKKVCAVGSNPRAAFSNALRALAKHSKARSGAFAGLGWKRRG